MGLMEFMGLAGSKIGEAVKDSLKMPKMSKPTYSKCPRSGVTVSPLHLRKKKRRMRNKMARKSRRINRKCAA